MSRALRIANQHVTRDEIRSPSCGSAVTPVLIRRSRPARRTWCHHWRTGALRRNRRRCCSHCRSSRGHWTSNNGNFRLRTSGPVRPACSSLLPRPMHRRSSPLRSTIRPRSTTRPSRILPTRNHRSSRLRPPANLPTRNRPPVNRRSHPVLDPQLPRARLRRPRCRQTTLHCQPHRPAAQPGNPRTPRRSHCSACRPPRPEPPSSLASDVIAFDPQSTTEGMRGDARFC
jgi:hypothetical protein